jgi:hypothetical protein
MGARAKWTDREDGARARRCTVAGCERLAVATLRADPAAPRAWLVDLDRAAPGEDLCGAHADALRTPVGWTLHDERARTSRTEHSIAGARRARLVAGAGAVPPQLDLRQRDADPAHEGPVDALLDARSPLLSRAFAKSREA